MHVHGIVIGKQLISHELELKSLKDLANNCMIVGYYYIRLMQDTKRGEAAKRRKQKADASARQRRRGAAAAAIRLSMAEFIYFVASNLNKSI